MLLAVAIRKAIATAFATWARASASGSIDSSGDVFSGTSTSAYGMVLASMSLSGKTYFEVDLDLSGETFITGFGAQANDGTTAPIDNFVGYNTTGVGGYPRTGYGWYVYFNAAATSGSPYSIGSSVDPSYRGGVAVDPATRKVWLRLVWSGGATAWAGGGDPEAGTTPTATIGGTDPIYPAACSKAPTSGACTATLLPNPADYYGAAPTGYTAGLSSTPIPFALNGTLTATAQVGVPYVSTLTLSGTYTGTVTMGTSAGALPSWMSVSVSGDTVTYSGTPDSTTPVSFTPTATDSSTPTARTATGTAQSITVSPAATGVPTIAQTPIQTNSLSTSPIDTTDGNSYLVFLAQDGITAAFTAPTDNKGNTYSPIFNIHSKGTYNYGISAWICRGGTGGSGHVWNNTNAVPADGSDYQKMAVIELAGCATSPVEASSTKNGSTTSSAPSNAITTAQADLILGLYAYDWRNAVDTYMTGAGTGYAIELDSHGHPGLGVAITVKSQTAGGSENPTATITNLYYYLTGLVALKGS